MKKTLTTALAMMLAAHGYSQNTFPASGNVGIGTTNPGFALDVTGNQNNSWNGKISGPNGQGVYFSHGGGYGMHVNAGSNASASTYVLEAYSNNLPRFYVRGDGNVGIGTSAPGYNLEVVGSQTNSWNGKISGPNGQGVYFAHGGGYGMHVNAGSNASAATYVLEAYSNNLPRFYVRGDGNVGIGTSAPGYNLEVVGSQTNNWNGMISGPNGQGVYFSHGGGYGMHVNAGSNASASTYVLEAYSNGVPRFYVRGDGNVGVGTNTPDSKLTVAGNIHTREVKVSVDAGADFVFQKNYNLKPLTEVAEYISANKHLPEIASADEMKKNGMELGEMNVKLLQKIEELTLHLIEQNKRIEQLEKQIQK